MINCIPVVGWIIAFLYALFIAIPTYFLWHWLGPTYFYFVPDVYKEIPFWHIVGLIWLLGILKSVLIPKFTFPYWSTTKKD